MIAECNNPQYIKIMSAGWLFTQRNEYVSHLYILSLK